MVMHVSNVEALVDGCKLNQAVRRRLDIRAPGNALELHENGGQTNGGQTNDWSVRV